MHHWNSSDIIYYEYLKIVYKMVISIISVVGPKLAYTVAYNFLVAADPNVTHWHTEKL